MTNLLSARTAFPLVAVAALALAACTDHPDATQPAPQDPNRFIVCGPGCGGGGGGGGGGAPPPPPYSISSMSLPNTTLAVDGVAGTYIAMVSNGGSAVAGVVAQGYVVQGSARRAAGGTLIDCHAGLGVLPNGSCQISFSVVASNSTSGGGSLVAGNATFELDLIVGSFTTTRTVGVNLVPGAFTMIPATLLSLSGDPVHTQFNIQNTGSQTIGGLNIDATVIQGSAHRSAGATPLSCTAGAGNLPPLVGCGMPFVVSLTNGGSGSGTLVPGAATLQVRLLQGTTVLNTANFPVTVVDIRFTAAAVTSSPALIGGIQSFTATVANAGGGLTGVTLNGFIRQGGTMHGNATATVNCGSGTGVLPAGTCTFTGTYSANNDRFGSGTLVPGAATLVLPLQQNGAPLDSTEVAITLANGPVITGVTPAASAIIGTPGPVVSYTGTINNPGPAVANVSTTVRLIQGSTNRAAFPGSQSVDCGSGAGTVPNGSCTFTSLFLASNTADGTGTLVPGPAILQIQLVDPINGVLITRAGPVTLVSP